MLPDYLAQCGMLSIWDIVEEGDASGAAKHTKDTINLSSKNCTF
jgi:hypothetical protein